MEKYQQIGIRGRLSKKLINTLSTHCATDTRTYKFTGKGWAKKVIKGILEIYVEEWWCFYELYLVKGDKTSIPKEISLENKLLHNNKLIL